MKDPATGRWLTRDPLGFANGINRYELVLSNPLAYRDPRGTLSLTVGEEIQYLWVDLLIGWEGDLGKTTCRGCRWVDVSLPCQFTSTSVPPCVCDGGRLYFASVTARAMPRGAITVQYADVIPPDGASAWILQVTVELERCIREHEDAHVGIIQQTYVQLEATGFGTACSSTAACAAAAAVAHQLLAIEKQNKLAAAEALHNQIEVPGNPAHIATCLENWANANAP